MCATSQRMSVTDVTVAYAGTGLPATGGTGLPPVACGAFDGQENRCGSPLATGDHE